jgi:hypothetical protein
VRLWLAKVGLASVLLPPPLVSHGFSVATQGAAAGSYLGLGHRYWAAIGGIGSLFGGGGGGGSSSGSQPGDAYAQFAAQMAAQNNPLTAAYQGLSLLQGALAGSIGQEATTKASAQLSMLTEALQRAQKDATLQASVAGYASG